MADGKGRGVEISPALLVIGLAAVLGLGAFAWLTFSPAPKRDAKPVLTPEAKAYLPYLHLSEVQPQTSESYIQRSLFEILGKLTNTGPKAIRDVLVTCVFRDDSGREVKRELVTVVGERSRESGGALGQNATKSFRLAFDDLPDEWNHQMPDLVIAQITFE